MSPIIAQRCRLLLVVLSLFFLTFLSFGRILGLSFGWDDYTTLYFTVHDKTFPYPYYADQLRFVPLFRLFGLASVPYYVIALILFSIDALLLMIVAYRLTRRWSVAIVSAVLFIVSSVGSDSMYYAVEGLRNTQFLFVLLLTIIAYPRLYITSFIGFLITTMVFPYRAFFVLPILLILDHVTIHGTLRSSMRRLMPFLLVTVFPYAIIPNLPGVKNFMGHIHPMDLLRTPILRHAENFGLTWLYLFVPDTFLGRFPDIAQTAKPFLPEFGIALALIIAVVLQLSKPRPILRFTSLSFWLLIATLLSFTLVIDDYMTTNYRYLFVVRPFAAMFGAGLLLHLASPQLLKRFTVKLSVVLLIGSFAIQLFEHVDYQTQVFTMRGTYAKQAIRTILTQVPAIRGNTLFFLDAKTNELRHRFTEAVSVGTLPAGASLATYYSTDYQKIEITDYVHCDVFRSVLKNWEGQPMDLYYFYATEKGITQGPKEKAFEACNITASEQSN